MEKGRVRTWIGTVFLLMALSVLLYPDFEDIATREKAETIRENFVEQDGDQKLDIANWEDTEMGVEESINNDESLLVDPVLNHIAVYNASLLDGSQNGAIEYREKTNAWDEEKVFGTIQIPSIGVDMPLYIGASEEHLDAGAAVLEGTSIPIGGDNTNSVIAGHRGWKGAAYFKEIESVSWGDEIIITNEWGSLSYRVVDMDIIEPDEIKPLLIQDGKDLITLVTCHPYRAPRDKRYVLYAERVVNSSDISSEKLVLNFCIKDNIINQKKYLFKKMQLNNSFSSSIREINLEQKMRRCICIGVIVVVFVRRKK